MRQLLKITSIFALALLFTAGTAFAQNESTVDQEGVNSSATVTQNSADDGAKNVADVMQNGLSSSHIAQITQTANQKAADNGIDPNKVDLRQTRQAGYSAEAYIVQGDESTFPSATAGNEVNLRQEGNVRADVQQGRTSTLEGFSGKFAIQRSTGAKSKIDVSSAGGNATVGVDQRGTNHQINATQGAGNNHNAQFLQRGSGHLAQVTQGVTAKEVEVRQYGSSNEAFIAQGQNSLPPGGVQRSNAYVRQDGTNLRTDIVQDGGANTANVTQNGSNGTVAIDQNGGEVYP
jgi:hypothetical protein